MPGGVLEGLFLLLSGLFSFILSLFLLVKPKKAIEIQQRFYSKINWRMEPISWEKEIRNTKLMGLSLMFLLSVLCLYVFFF